VAELAVAQAVTRVPGGSAGRARRARPTPASFGLRTIAVLYVGILVLVPLVVILYRTFQPGLDVVWTAISDPNAVHAYQVTAIVAASAVVINTVFGIAVGVLLARYRFWGSRLLDAFVDLPVAVSPIVVGLALVLVFGPTGWFGPFLQDHGVTVIAAKPGMILATVFVSLPLVVRAVVPVLRQAGVEQEQAAASLGANAFTRFRRITLPTIRIALTYGVVLSMARCLGEYGAVLVVSNNIEGQTETVPLRIGNKVELEQNYQAAYALTLVLIVVSFAAILVSAWIRRRGKES
jgi:sulfate transport system permease protein